MRLKPKNSITCFEQAEAALARIDEIDRCFAGWDLAEAEAVQKVRDGFNEKRKAGGYIEIETKRAFLARELEAWAETDAANWGKKTMETAYGSFGYRVSQPSVALVKKVARSFKHALGLLEKRLPEFVRTAPEVDKEAILAADRERTLDAKALRECGLEVRQAEEFWLESNAAKDLESAVKKLRAA